MEINEEIEGLRSKISAFEEKRTVLYKILDEDRIAIVGVVHGQRLFESQWLQ